MTEATQHAYIYICIYIYIYVYMCIYICIYLWGFPGGASGKEPVCQCRRHKRHGFNSWVGKIPWRRVWQHTPIFLPGESYGQRSLASYSPQGSKESDKTETHTHTHTQGLYKFFFIFFSIISYYKILHIGLGAIQQVLEKGLFCKDCYYYESQSEVAQSCPTLCDRWTVAHQAPPSMGFSRQEYWSGLPFPSPGDLPHPGIEPRSPTLQADVLTSAPPGKPL